MATVIPDFSPLDLLGRFRGTIFRAAPGYPEVIHLNVRDRDGEIWRFSTFYAEYSPSDPDFFPGKTIVDIDLDPSGTSTIAFSDGSTMTIVPGKLGPDEPGDDLETWNLITPDGLSLWFGPRGRWQLKRASDPV